MRDDFPVSVKQVLADRAGNSCSRPSCRALTSGPQVDPTKAVNVGVAAHITGASRAGPRYEASLSPEQRRHADNGIWLCQNCGKLADNDTSRFSVEELRSWKGEAEAQAIAAIGRAGVGLKPEKAGRTAPEREIKRALALKKRLQRDLLRRSTGFHSGPPPKPYAKFKYGEAIVRSTTDTWYPSVDESPGISSWFRVELWDFYFNGIEVILGIRHGVLDAEGRWSLVDYNQPFDHTRYAAIKIWELGRIPYRNIAEYDPDGDEYYPIPHFFCRFANDGMPYEGFVYRMVAEDYDWPLDAERQLNLKEEAIGSEDRGV